MLGLGLGLVLKIAKMSSDALSPLPQCAKHMVHSPNISHQNQRSPLSSEVRLYRSMHGGRLVSLAAIAAPRSPSRS